MIEIVIDTNSDEIILPIAPEEIEITMPGNNESAEVIGLGEVKILRQPGLATFEIESFIPDDEDGDDFIDAIKNWMESESSADLNIGDLGINMDVCINDFTYSRRSGEEDRVYYTLSLSEYRAYGARIITQVPTAETIMGNLITTATAILSGAARVDNSAPVQSTYTVIRGDSLWTISKKLIGSGSYWRSLYDANSDIIGSNPSSIAVGQVLTVPRGWVT